MHQKAYTIVDKSGIFYKLLPDKTSAMKCNLCKVLLRAKMDGSNKLKPYVIGKLTKHLAFCGVCELPCTYDANKAWMIAELFKKLLRAFDARMGVFRQLKHHFHSLLVQDLLRKVVLGKELVKWNVLEAIRAIAISWSMITAQSVVGCFRHAGFHMWKILLRPWRNLSALGDTPGEVECAHQLKQLVSADVDTEVCGELNDEELINFVTQKDMFSEDDGNSESK
ncbi:hypothetical protein PR048_009207 [Dryococelus australis]|uniref:DDE-1 domain-containing protein n=1 Tax=Dryococelus australis TaxID=614101 RepID=A0ABQ9HZ87_9NEOP|nr:hypothetical protein PR048_009207 [Dryococelus australis]